MKITQQVIEAVQNATRKFPTWPTDPLHALAILGEEYGELNKAVLQLTYEPEKFGEGVDAYEIGLQQVRKEALQTAAMAVRFLMSLDQYKYLHSEQHTQAASVTETTES